MIRRIRRLFQKTRSESELDQELRFHLERQIADYVKSGISPEEARRRARLDFGGLERVKDEVREAHWDIHLDNLFRDLKFGVRNLRKDRRFALTAILALALGIGASTVIFSVIYNGLLRPFPYKNADRLATFSIHDLQDPDAQALGRGDRGGFTSAEFIAFQEQSRSFEDLIGFMSEEMPFSNGKETLEVHAALVTPNTFQSLGVDPLLGRRIIAEDAKTTEPPVFAMNYRLWRDHFNADPKIVGNSFAVGGVPRILVAIMPPRFQINPEGSDVWIPTIPIPSDSNIPMNAAEPMHLWWPLGHVAPRAKSQAGSSDLNLIAQRLAKSLPQFYPPKFTMTTRPFVDVVLGNFRSTLYALVGAVAILLLITCTNVANLLLARGSTREKEIAIRASVGASRGRLIRQLLFESFVLAAAGALLGCMFAYWGLKGFLLVLPSGVLPAEAAMTLNPSVLFFALGVTIFTALLCGVLPAIHSLRGDLYSRLTGSSKGAGGDIRGGKMRASLVIAETALSLVLLVAEDS